MVFSNYREQQTGVGLAWSNNPTDPTSWNWFGNVYNNPNGSDGSFAPCLVEYNGTWYLFFSDWSGPSEDPHNIVVITATSVTGPYSTPTVVLSPDPGTWENWRVDEPYVFQRNDGKWIMMYMADSTTNDDPAPAEQVGYAYADNILGPYTKYAGNPVLAFGSPGSIDAGTVADPWVLQCPGQYCWQGAYYIGYTASPTSTWPWQMAYATTTDWQTFTKHGMLLPESSSGWDEINSFRGAVYQVGETYILSYTGGQYEMGIATQPVMSTTADIINNPAAVFDFYDGFDGTSLDSSKWAIASGSSSQAVEAGGTLTLTATSASPVEITSLPTFGMNYIVEAHAQHPQQGVLNMIAQVGLVDSAFGNRVRIVDDYPTSTATWEKQAELSGQPDSNWSAMAEAADQQWHVFSVYRLSSDVAGFQIDGNKVESVTSDVPTTSLSAFLMSSTEGASNQLVSDWIRVRKFVSPQPVAALDPVSSIAISPSTASISTGGSQSYTAQDFDQYGNSLANVTASTTFTISPNGSCTGASCTASIAGAHTVTGAYSGMTSPAASLQVDVGAINPEPSTTSLSPSSATAGGSAFTLTVNGSGFVNGSVVLWNGSNRTTTYASSTQLTAAIKAADITSAGTAQVTVFSPTPGGGTSNAQTFTINNPVPATTGLSPASTPADGAAFTLTVNGTGFVSGSTVNWNGSNVMTTYGSSTQVKAAIAAADIALAGTALVTVVNPPPGGGASNAQTFTVSGLALDESTPAAVKNNTQTLTTASFTPPAGSVLYICVMLNSTTGITNGENYLSQITDNLSTHLTYTLQKQYGTASTNSALVYLYTAPVSTPQAMTVSITQNATNTAGNNAMLQVLVITGANSSSPVGNTAGAWGTTTNISGTVYNSSVNNSWSWLIYNDWNAEAVPTVPYGETVYGLYTNAALTAAVIENDSVTATSGTAVTLGTATPTSGVELAWLAFEMKPVTNNPVPTTTGLSPSSTPAEGAAFALTVNGTGFVSGSTVNWNGSSRTTTYVSATQLTAAITAADIATAGTASVTVANPAPGGGTSNAQTFTINNAVLTTTGLSPTSATAGGAGFTLTVNGTAFVSGSTVNWNGSGRTTTYVSATQLTAAITAADIATPGTASVTVVNPAPGGGTSNAQTFTMNNAVLSTTGLSPTSATAGGAGFTLTVNGTAFASGSTVNWNGSSRATTYVSSTQLTAVITAADIATAGTAQVTVVNPAPGGGTSNAQTFTINNPVPTTTGLSPASATAGGAGFTLTVNGTGFVSGSTVNWKGSNRTTTYVSSTQVTAAITAADIATAGTASVTVVNGTPGGGTSNAQTFTINNPVPATTSLSPTSATAGGAGFTLTVNGTGFVSGSTVNWKGSSRTTTYVSSAQVTAAITAADVATAGTASVTVVNGTPGGGTSNAQTFTINNPVPTTTSLSPSSTPAEGAGFTLTVNGTGFVSSSTVNWNGSNRTTTYVSSTQVTAAITAADIATAGTASVTVVNGTPGGGASIAQTFTINNAVLTTTGLSPSSATVGGGGFALTVTGSAFVSGSTVNWNGSARTTTYVSATQLTAAITAADIATAGTASVTVVNPAPGGGTSNAQTFTINNPVPTTTGLSPASATAGGAALTLTVNGTGFVSGSTVNWKGSARTTTYVSATQVTAAITAADIATAGTASVTVVNATPGGGTSNAQTFTIIGLALNPSTPAAVKNNAQTLTTASFTPPAGSVLYICVMLNSTTGITNGENYLTQITDNLSTHLTYTLQKQYGTASTNSALVYLYTAPVSTAQAMTVSITQNATNTAGNNAMLQVLVITGANSSSPVGNTAGAWGPTTNISGTVYNSSVNDSWSWLIYNDWNAEAVPTVPSGETVYGSYTNIALTAAVIENNSVTATSGTAVTLGTSTPTSGVELAWIAFEMKP
jgi:hypothetical protein